MGNGGATLGAEDTVDVIAGGALAGVLLDRALDFQAVLGNDGHQSYTIDSRISISVFGFKSRHLSQ